MNTGNAKFEERKETEGKSSAINYFCGKQPFQGMFSYELLCIKYIYLESSIKWREANALS